MLCPSVIGRFGPTRDSCIAAKSFLFDHLVGAQQQRGRHGEAERFGRLHVDHELEFGRLLYRQIGRLGAFEDLIDVAACTAQ
jgi:hypothetical protein